MELRVCVWDCGPALVYFSLSSFCWWTGLVTLVGEFCGPSFNILGDSKCISPLFHTEEQVVMWRYFSQKAAKINYSGYSYQVKLQLWFLSLRLKTCLWAELQPWCLSFQRKTCPWAEHSDDILINFGRSISLLKYWWAHPIKSATSRHCFKCIFIDIFSSF